MKNIYRNEIKEIIMNEIDKLCDEIPEKRSLIDPLEFMNHLQKRKFQLSYIMDNFDEYIYFVDEHISEKYGFYSESKTRIPIQMVAIDIILGERITKALINHNKENNYEQKSYFEIQAKQIEWILSCIDIDRTFESFKKSNSLYAR